MNFNITETDKSIRKELIDKINNLTKPKGSLGVLEDLALRIGLIQHSLSPTLLKPHNVIFAADHGVVEENVSLSPKEVTWQQLANFLKGGAGVNFLCRQHGFELVIVDSGVDYNFPINCGIIDKKIAHGTKNYVYEPALTLDQTNKCLESGAQVVDDIYKKGCNVISFGEMGIANTSSSSLWMSYFANIPLRECIGAGSGLSKDGIEHKCNVLQRAKDNYENNYKGKILKDNLSLEIISYFGGFEMVMAVGAMLKAAELHMVILVDGFIMTNCILAAKSLYPNVLDYAIFGHLGDENGHKKVLEALEAKPILSLGLRLGEGTGAICSYPIVDSAVRMINEMETFKSASITKYF